MSTPIVRSDHFSTGCAGERVVLKTADLHVATKGIVHVKAIKTAVAHVVHSHPNQFGLSTFAVEISDRIADMIDSLIGLRSSRRRGILWPIARDHGRDRYILGGDVVQQVTYSKRQGEFRYP